MRADEPIDYRNVPNELRCVEPLADYINKLRYERLMRGKKIAELEAELSRLVDTGVSMRKCQRIAEALEARAKRIKELESRRLKWISVEERLPPKLEDVLLTNGNECKQGYLCQYWCKENEPLWNFADGLDIIPTHWMPLPPPTTEKEN